MQFHLLLQVLIEVPYAFVQAMVYDVIVYVLIGFEWTAAKFFWYLFFTYFSLLYFTFYGMMTVAVTPNYHISSIIASAFYTIWNLFSGFIVPRPVSFSTLFQLYFFFFFSTSLLYICQIFHITNLFSLVFYFTTLSTIENPYLVEMVLLGMSISLDLVWIGCITVWR